MVISNWFVTILISTLWIGAILYARYAAKGTGHQYSTDINNYRGDICKICRNLKSDHMPKRPKRAWATMLALAAINVAFAGLSTLAASEGENLVGIQYPSQITILSRYTDIADGVTQQRTIGQFANSTVVEVSSLKYGSTVSVNSTTGLMMLTNFGLNENQRQYGVNTIPIGKLKFPPSDQKPGSFTTTFYFNDDLPKELLIPLQDYEVEDCRWTVVNLAFAKHCEVVKHTTREVTLSEDKVFSNLNNILNLTVKDVAIGMAPEYTAVLVGALPPEQ